MKLCPEVPAEKYQYVGLLYCRVVSPPALELEVRKALPENCVHVREETEDVLVDILSDEHDSPRLVCRFSLQNPFSRSHYYCYYYFGYFYWCG